MYLLPVSYIYYLINLLLATQPALKSRGHGGDAAPIENPHIGATLLLCSGGDVEKGFAEGQEPCICGSKSRQDESGACNLLQAQASAKRRGWPSGGFTTNVSKEKGICANLSHQELASHGLDSAQDWFQPISEVAKKYDTDGWCAFGQTGNWASECAVCNQKRDVRSFINQHLAWCGAGS